MSRDVQAMVSAILRKPDMTIIAISIPTEHTHGVELDDLITLNIKESS